LKPIDDYEYISDEYLMSLSIYYIWFFILSFFSFVSLTKQGKKYNFIILLTASIFMILFAGLRAGSGDQEAYRAIFFNVAPLDEVLVGSHNYESIYGEWGFLFANSLIKFFFNSDVVMFIIMAFVSIGFVAYSCRRISPYPLVSLLCYYSWFFASNLGPIRHAIASSLILLMIVFLANNKKLFAVTAYFSAVFVHKISALAVFIWISNDVSKMRGLLSLVLVFSIIVSLMGGIAEEIISSIFPFVGDDIKSKLLLYSQMGMGNTRQGLLNGIVIKQLLITSVCLYYMNALRNKFPSFSFVFWAYMISTLTLILFNDFKIISDRVSNIFAISEIIIIPMLISLFSGKDKIIVFLMLSFILFYQMHLLIGNQLYPYKFILIRYFT
jgi:hypothetical protein